MYKLWFYKYFLIVSALVILAYLLDFYSSEFFLGLLYELHINYQFHLFYCLFSLSNILLKSFNLFSLLPYIQIKYKHSLFLRLLKHLKQFINCLNFLLIFLLLCVSVWAARNINPSSGVFTYGSAFPSWPSACFGTHSSSATSHAKA